MVLKSIVLAVVFWSVIAVPKSIQANPQFFSSLKPGNHHLDFKNFFDGSDLSIAPVWNVLGVRGDFVGVDVLQNIGKKGHEKILELVTWGTDFFGGSLDLKIYPLQLSDWETDYFHPYFIFGLGGFYRNPSTQSDRDRFPGFGGNIAMGMDLALNENLSLGLEQSFRPMMTHEDTAWGLDDTSYSDSNLLWTTMAKISFRF